MKEFLLRDFDVVIAGTQLTKPPLQARGLR
jgi:hypothetical protein